MRATNANRWWVVTIAVLVGVNVLACNGSSKPRTIETSRQDLQPVLVPNMKSIGDLGREQIYRRELLLMGCLTDAAVSDYELSLAYGELGKLYQVYAFPESAVNCFTNAHQLDPLTFAWPYYRARCHAALEDHQAALASAETAVRIRPQDLPALVLLGNINLKLNRLDEAQTAYDEALLVDPQCAPAWFWLGQIALTLDDHDSATEALETVLRLQPQASRAHYSLAMAYRAAGETDLAEQHLARKGKVLPSLQDPLMDDLTNYNVATLQRRGSNAFRGNEPEEAVKLLERTMRIDPDDFTSRMNLGSSYVRIGDADRALEQYREALRIKPGNYLALFNMGSVLLNLDRVEEGVESLRGAVAAYPDHGPSCYLLALGLRRLGNHDEALLQVEAAVRNDPRSEPARVLRAQLLARLGECRAAVSGLEEDCEFFPDSLALPHMLARLLATCSDDSARDPTRALGLARELFEKEPTAEHGTTVALALAAAGDFAGAVSWQQKAIGLLAEDDPPQLAMTMQDLLRVFEKLRMPVVEW